MAIELLLAKQQVDTGLPRGKSLLSRVVSGLWNGPRAVCPQIRWVVLFSDCGSGWSQPCPAFAFVPWRHSPTRLVP